MKSKLFEWSVMTTLLCALSCTGESVIEEVDQGTASNQKTIEVVMPPVEEGDEREETRTNITPDMQITWGANDTIGIFPDVGDQVHYAISGGAGSMVATFTGGAWGLKDNRIYDAYFPYARVNSLDADGRKKIPVSFYSQYQDGNNSTAHLGKYDYMAAKGEMTSAGKVSLPMQHLVTFLQFNITLPKDASVASLYLYSEKNGFYSAFPNGAILSGEGVIDLSKAEPAITPVEKCWKMLKMVCKNLHAKADEQFTITMAAIPVDLSGEKLLVKCNLVDGGYYTTAIEISKAWKAGKIYRHSIAYSRLSFVATQGYEVSAFLNSSAEKRIGLNQAVNEVEQSYITRLTAYGMNSTDYRLIRQLAGGALMRVESENIPSPPGNLKHFVFAGLVYGGGEPYFYESDWYGGGFVTRYGDYIPEYLFYKCPRLESFSTTGFLEEVGYRAFYGCDNLKSVNFDNSSVKEIPDEAFSGCNSLEYVKLPSCLERMGTSFWGCRGLKSINIPGKVKELVGTFDGCSSLSSVTFSSHLDCIGPGTFRNCDALQNLDVSASVIGERAFESSGLKSIKISGAKVLGQYAFNWCSDLEEVTFVNPLFTEIGSYAFKLCLNLKSIEIPKSVLRIGYNAFEDCRSLRSVTLNDNLEEISGNAFYKSGISKITLPKSLTYIGMLAFGDCKITEIVLPESLTYIAAGAFMGCKIPEVTLPKTLKNIYGNSFDEYTKVFYLYSSVPPVMKENGLNVSSNGITLHVPKGTKDAYKASKSWGNIDNIVDDL